MYFRLEMCVYLYLPTELKRLVFESRVVLVADCAIDHLHVLVYSIYSIYSIVVHIMQSIKTEYINFHSEPFYYHIFPLFFFCLCFGAAIRHTKHCGSPCSGRLVLLIQGIDALDVVGH